MKKKCQVGDKDGCITCKYGSESDNQRCKICRSRCDCPEFAAKYGRTKPDCESCKWEPADEH